MRSTRARIVWVALASGLLFAAACTNDDAKTPPPARKGAGFVIPADQRERIDIRPVAPTTFRPAVETNGTVAFNGDRSTQVLSPISGPVARIVVNPGSYVHPGDPLAYVSSPDFAEAISTLRKAAAAAVNSQRIADQDAELFKNDAIARRDMEQAQTDALSAAADRDAAMLQVRSLGVDSAAIEDIRGNHPIKNPQGVIRAPIEGTVVEKLITPGQLLQAGSTPAFTIADLSSVWVMANVFESDLDAVTRGDTVDVTTNASPNALHGIVDYIAALVDPSSKATGVRVVVPNTHHLLKKDMYVTVTIHSRRPKSGLLVPVAAVLRDDDNLPFVFVDTPDGFARHSVKLGSRVGEQYEVTSGLTAGDRVVSQGGLFLQFAQNQ